MKYKQFKSYGHLKVYVFCQKQPKCTFLFKKNIEILKIPETGSPYNERLPMHPAMWKKYHLSQKIITRAPK